MNRIEDYSWMALGQPDPGYEDTVTISVVSGVNPWAPREHQLSDGAGRPRVRDRIRMLLVAPGKNRRDDEKDKSRDTEHAGRLSVGASQESYPEREDTCPIALPGREPWWVAAVTTGRVTAAVTVPGARLTAAASSARMSAAATTRTYETVPATAPARRRARWRRRTR